MNLRDLFTRAHEIARETVESVGDYKIAFKLALQDARAEFVFKDLVFGVKQYTKYFVSQADVEKTIDQLSLWFKCYGFTKDQVTIDYFDPAMRVDYVNPWLLECAFKLYRVWPKTPEALIAANQLQKAINDNPTLTQLHWNNMLQVVPDEQAFHNIREVADFFNSFTADVGPNLFTVQVTDVNHVTLAGDFDRADDLKRMPVLPVDELLNVGNLNHPTRYSTSDHYKCFLLTLCKVAVRCTFNVYFDFLVFDDSFGFGEPLWI